MPLSTIFSDILCFFRRRRRKLRT